MLEQEDVARYLLDRGLIGPEALLDGELTIRDASSRNRNYRVQTSQGPCYFIKQGTAADSAASVAYEASVYERLIGGEAVLASYLPRFFGYDHEQALLILELVRDADDLRSLHLSSGHFPPAPAALLGSALGALHRATQAGSDPSPPVALAPWILSVHRPDANVFRDLSSASLELIRIVQGSEGFPEALDALRQDWRAECLVHGDVKWDNCLVSSRADGSQELRLIDWEGAVSGEACWDIGSALSHYLSFWLFSIPVTGSVPPERFPELATYPLDAMKPALGACWIAYADERRFDDATAARELVRAVACAGARLVQAAFEAAQMMNQITSAAVLHLQLALNILQRPQDAATELLGLPLTRPAVV
jgi:hypothetical protein